MPDRSGTKHDVMVRQERMLRLAERDHDISAKVLALETGIPLSTVQSWRRAMAPAAMSLPDFVAVARFIPDDLLTLVFEAAGKHVGTSDSEGDGALDALIEDASCTIHEIAKAKRDGRVTPQERANIVDCAQRLAATARAVAA